MVLNLLGYAIHDFRQPKPATEETTDTETMAAKNVLDANFNGPCVPILRGNKGPEDACRRPVEEGTNKAGAKNKRGATFTKARRWRLLLRDPRLFRAWLARCCRCALRSVETLG